MTASGCVGDRRRHPVKQNVAVVLVAHDYTSRPCYDRCASARRSATSPSAAERGAAVETCLPPKLHRARVARVHTPIGVDLGGKRPEKSRSILAEVVAVRNGNW
jgi:hypothetical protein